MSGSARLDPDQARVVRHDDGPAAVLAGAGSGKTRCTTERAVRRIVEAGVAASSLLLLTFTNKAASEMRERIAERLPNGLAAPWVGTFHGFGNQLLRRHGTLIGVPPSATLMDADDAGRMLEALLAGPFPDRARRLDAIRLHEALVAAGLDATRETDLAAIHERCIATGFGAMAIARLIDRLRRYDREKRRAAVMDFADLIMLPIRLLETRADCRDELIGGLRDLTVDEAQDTDGAQFRLLRLIMPAGRTVVLVGDDDQAIYEWRHARPENLRRFIDEEDATVYRLERNYRSTPAIVGSGARLVRHNEARLEKHPYAVRRSGGADRPRLTHWDDADAMAEGVAERIEATLRAGGDPADIAVLYRKNRLARPLETALLRRAIPYRVKAGMDLLAHADVRMMLAAGRLAANARDVRALSRLADLAPGLGNRGVGRLIEAGEEPLQHAGILPPRAAAGVSRLATALDNLRRRGPARLLDWCQEEAVFSNWLRQRARHRRAASEAGDVMDASEAMRPALARLSAVQRAMSRRLETLPDDADTPRRWGTALEIVATGADEAETDKARVTLATIHGAKGLEWPIVHLFGVSEGLMPMMRERVVENLAEERRLAYVAVTRAADRLELHHAERMDLGVGNGVEPVTLSRFVAELDAGDALERHDQRRGSLAGSTASPPALDWLARMRENLG